MKSEAEMRARARLNELLEKMKSIQQETRKHCKNIILYSENAKEMIQCYHDVALLLYVLDERGERKDG